MTMPNHKENLITKSFTAELETVSRHLDNFTTGIITTISWLILRTFTNQFQWNQIKPSYHCATGASGRQRRRVVRQQRWVPSDSWLDQLPSASPESYWTAPTAAAAVAISHHLPSLHTQQTVTNTTIPFGLSDVVM